MTRRRLVTVGVIALAILLLIGAVVGRRIVRWLRAPGAKLTITFVDASGGRARTEIERRPQDGTEFKTVTALPPGLMYYVDTGVRRGTTYCYRARAVDVTSGAKSGYTEPVCAAPQ